MSNQSFGNTGENVVVTHFQQHGFTIKAQNYRKFFGEVDIIACKKQLYVFVEVKTRRSSTIAMRNLISLSKQQKIIKTAETYIVEHKISNNVCRFDVALVRPNATSFSVEYIENAFTKNEGKYEPYI